MNNYTTLNTPKHLVTLGRPVPKRLNGETYHYTVDLVMSNLRRYGIPRDTMLSVPSCRNRASYGDIDILILESSLKVDWEKGLSSNVFGKGFYAKVPNTNITVFEYSGYQINIHTVKGGIPELRRVNYYLRYEGLSGLLEILADSLGFTYEARGVYLKTGLPENSLLKVDLIKIDASTLFGYSDSFMEYYIYSERDNFDFILKSNYFNRRVFLELESKPEYPEIVVKYPIVSRFIAYLKANENITGECKFELNEARYRKQYTKHISAVAPALYAEYVSLANTHKKALLISEKFNPEVITKITGLEGEEALQLMDAFAKKFKGESQFNLFVLTSLPGTLSKALLDLKATLFKSVEETSKVNEVAKVDEVVEAATPKKPSNKKTPSSKEKPKVKKSEVEKPKAKPKAKKAATTTVPRALPVVSEPADNSFALAA